MNNFLLSSSGRRVKLIECLKKSIGSNGKIIVTDNSNMAPSLYCCDNRHIVPKIFDEKYIDALLKICVDENISMITSLIDPEIEVLADNKERFIEIGVLPLVPSKKTSNICYDKYLMYEYLIKNDVATVLTYDSMDGFKNALKKSEISFPVFIKPRFGSGSVDARKINSISDLEYECNKNSEYIIQEYMQGEDIDADVYVDAISNEVVSAFLKKKIETKIGGASKTISFIDKNLFAKINEINKLFEFCGPIDIDFFYCNEKYYLSEINPRFGGACIHAFAAGVDFTKLIINNINKTENNVNLGNYEEDIIMMMYDDIIILKKGELL